jgi:hypothetical protein
VTRDEALARIDKMIEGLKSAEEQCSKFRSPTFTKFGIFIKAAHTELQEIRWAL